MTQKLTPFFLARRIAICVSRNHPFFCTFNSTWVHTSSALIAPKSSEIESAIVFLKKNLHPDALASVLHSVSDVSSATAIFRWSSCQKSFQQTAETYALMILRLGLSGNCEEMEALLKEMIKLDFLNLDSSLGFLVESFCTNQRPMEALKVFEIARSAKLRFLLSTCNVLLRILVSECNNFGLVLFVYKEMVKAGIPPDVDTLNCVIKGLCELGRLDLALIQFQRMKHKNCTPDSLTFELIISSLCSGGRIDEAVETWKQMLQVKCSLNQQFYARIIPLFCGANKINESVKLFKMMKDDGNSPDVYLYSVLIECLSDNLKLKDAVEMLDEMSHLGFSPRASSYVHIVNGYCKLGNFNEAMNFLNRNIDCPVEPYHALLSSFCELDRLLEAFNFLEEMLKKNFSDGISWNIVIKGLCKKGNVRKAFEVICRMVVFSYFPDTFTYSSLITGYCRNAEFDKAFQIFKQELVQDLCLDLGSCSELIEGLCYSKKIQDAIEVFYHIASRGGSPNLSSLNILINGICDIGKVDEAIKVRFLASCNGTRFSSSTYTPILTRLLDLNKERCILPALAQMFVEGCTLDQNAYSFLILGLCIRGRGKIASDLFNRMIDDGIIPEPGKLETFVEGFAKCSIMKLVVQSLEKLVEAGAMLGPFVCNVVISSLLKEGDKSVACKFLDWMLERDWVPDPYTHALLVGNIDSEARVGIKNSCVADTDSVGNILAEGLKSSP